MEFRLASAAFIAVFATYLFLGGMGVTDRGNLEPRDVAYNQLTRGLLSGHLYLDTEVPPGLAALRNPYDPSENASFRVDPRYRLHDRSFYHGRIYLYFGIAPALVLFLPWHVLTGLWLPHWAAVIFLCAVGVLVNLSLFYSVKVRVFPGAAPWATAVAVLILGLGSYAPVVLARADLWEIPIAFGYVALSIALRCLWEALISPGKSATWIAFASAAIGIGFASRPTVLPAAAILLAPLVDRACRRNPWTWIAAMLPLALCGVGVALYNDLRFGSFLEFGRSYMLSGESRTAFPDFGASYFWTNVRINLFQSVAWLPVFPFAHELEKWILKPNIAGAEHVAGVLVNCPFLWAALAVPVFIWSRRPERGFVILGASVAWTALSTLSLILFFCGASDRYQLEYVSGLALLASMGMLALESLPAGLPRLAARCVWVPALLVSLAFPVLYGIDWCVIEHNSNAVMYLSRGDLLDAETEIQNARFLSPGSPASRLISGMMLAAVGKSPEAERGFEALILDFPGYAMAHYGLANVLAGERRWDDAIAQYGIAHALRPEDPVIKAGLDAALARSKASKAYSHLSGKTP